MTDFLGGTAAELAPFVDLPLTAYTISIFNRINPSNWPRSTVFWAVQVTRVM